VSIFKPESYVGKILLICAIAGLIIVGLIGGIGFLIGLIF